MQNITGKSVWGNADPYLDEKLSTKQLDALEKSIESAIALAVSEATPAPGQKSEVVEAAQLFDNNSDCYADTGKFLNDGGYTEGEVIPAMTKDAFLKLLPQLKPYTPPAGAAVKFQCRVDKWLLACFGKVISRDKIERNHRFLEEALELVQSLGCTSSEAHQLVDYVFNRPVGEPIQECGGVMVTLAALCVANDLDMNESGEIELERIWTKVEKIREKQLNKPKHSPLPIAAGAAVTEEGKIETSKVNRVEVIGEKRDYVNWDDKNKVELDFQDGGRTLKIFITKK